MKYKHLLLIGATALGIGLWVEYKVYAQNVRKPSVVQFVVRGEDGKAVLQVVEAVRSDGATMTETLELSGNRGHLGIREVIIPNQNTLAMIDRESRTIMISTLTSRQVSQHTAAVQAACDNAFQLPNVTTTCTSVAGETFLGHPVYRVRQTLSLTDGKSSVKEMLAASDLDWKPLELTVFEDGKVVQSKRATLVQGGDPDSNMFTIPTDLTAVNRPSEFIERSFKTRGKISAPSILSKLDEAFESRQKNDR